MTDTDHFAAVEDHPGEDRPAANAVVRTGVAGSIADDGRRDQALARGRPAASSIYLPGLIAQVRKRSWSPTATPRDSVQ